MRILLACLALGTVLTAQPLDTAAQNTATAGGGFRGAAWGAGPEEVVRLEGREPLRRDESLLVFAGRFHDYPAHVVYFFAADRLLMGFYQVGIEHENLDDYFADYQRLKNAMSGEFGLPAVENWQFTDRQIEDQRDIWGDALGYGLLKVETGWLQDGSAVALRLSGGDFRAHLMAVFTRGDLLDRGRLAYHAYFREKVGVPNPYFRR